LSPRFAVSLAFVPQLLGGCVELPEIRYETEHLRVGTYFDEEVCAGSLAELDAHAVYVGDELGIELGDPIEVYWLEVGQEPPSSLCPSGAASCFQDGRVITTWPAARHELVHAVVHELVGFTSPDEFFGEGVAEGFTGLRSEFGAQSPSLAVGAVDSSEVDFASAAHFMRWLHAEHGTDDLHDLLKRSAIYRGPRHAERIFERTYGIPLVEAEEEYWATAPELVPGDTFCDFPTLGEAAPGVQATIRLDCAEEHTRGVQWLERTYTIDVDVPGVYVFELEEPAELIPWFCHTEPIESGDGDWPVVLPPVRGDALWELEGQPPDAWWISAGRSEVFLGIGRYRLDFRVDGKAATEFRFRVHPVMGPSAWP
jgi:hypothetical protein